MSEFISAPLALAAEQFAKLPGIGIKTAQRLAYHMLNLPAEEVEDFAQSLIKARRGVQGAYAAINRAFARYIRERYPSVRYLDREEDMGIEGLRQAKRSYHPLYRIEEFCAEYVEDEDAD